MAQTRKVQMMKIARAFNSEHILLRKKRTIDIFFLTKVNLLNWGFSHSLIFRIFWQRYFMANILVCIIYYITLSKPIKFRNMNWNYKFKKDWQVWMFACSCPKKIIFFGLIIIQISRDETNDFSLNQKVTSTGVM